MKKQIKQQEQPNQIPPQQKQFRLTSEGFRKSYLQEVRSKFQKEENLFFEVLEQLGCKRNQTISHDSQFYLELNDNTKEVLQLLIDQVEQETRNLCTTECLVSKILEIIQNFHIDNQEDQVEINTYIDFKKIVDSIYDRIASSQGPSLPLGSKPYGNKCTMEIYHIANLSLATDIFKHYQIKYKAKLLEKENVSNLLAKNSTGKQTTINYKSIYEQKSLKLWKEPFTENASILEIGVFGKRKSSSTSLSKKSSSDQLVNGSVKRKQKKTQKDPYLLISKVVVDFDLIYACINPKSLDNQDVHTQVNIQFKDQSVDPPPYKGLTSIQLGINFNLDDETKLLVMDRLLAKYGNEVEKLNCRILERNTIILETLKPFKNKITYKPGKGLEPVTSTEERQNCQICSIF